jgi:hypothetical protein
MSINIDGSFEAGESGIAIVDFDGNVKAYFCSGTGAPVGSPAPVNTWFFATDTNLLYYKFASGDNDWRQIRADDIAFDVSALSLKSPDLVGLTQTYEVVAALSQRVFGKEYGYTGFNPTFQTTSADFVPALTVSRTLPIGINHQIRVGWSYYSSNSAANTSNETQIAANGSQLVLNPVSGGVENFFSNFREFTFAGTVGNGGVLTMTLDLRRTAGNGNARVRQSSLEIWRVS